MTEEAAQDDGWTWAKVEIFGHTKHYGRAREEDKLGVKMLRIDVPKFESEPVGDVPTRWETYWYGAASIFSIAITDEESVMKANKPYESPYRHRLTHDSTREIELQADPSDDGMPF
jgi:hypothetical protein